MNACVWTWAGARQIGTATPVWTRSPLSYTAKLGSAAYGLPTPHPLNQVAVPGAKLAWFARFTAVWMLPQVCPAASAVVSLVVTVTSQLAWWLGSEPQAGEKRVALAVTPVTGCTQVPLGVVTQPP